MRRRSLALLLLVSIPSFLFAATEWGQLNLALNTGNYAQAEEMIRAGSELQTNAVHQAALGLILTKRRQYAKAEKAFKEAGRLEPGNPNHQWNLAEFYYLTGAYPKAAATYALVPDGHQQKHLAQYKEILSLLLSDQTDAAIRKITHLRFDERNPLYLHAHAALRFSRSEMAEGRWFAESARTLYEKDGVTIYRQPLVDLGWIAWE